MSIASRFLEWIFSSPFLWMALLGVVVWHSLIKHTINASIVYAPLLEEKANYNLSGNLLFSFLLATAAALFVYYTDTALDVIYVIGFWFISFAFSTKGRETIGFLVSAFLLGIAAVIFDTIDTVSNILLYAGLYQTIIGVLYLFGRKDTYPIMQQEKDGTVHGELMFKSAWIMPAAVISTVIMNDPIIVSSMIVLLLFSETRMNKETPIRFFRRNGVFAIISGCIVIMFSFLKSDVFAVLGIIIALAVSILWWIIESTSYKKKKYLFVADDTGVRVLYVYNETPACEMGIQTGDKITHINDKRIVTYEALDAFLEEKPPFIWLKYEREDKTLESEYKDYANGIGELGIVAVPRNPSKYELYPRKGFIASKLESIFRRSNRK